jgi:biopolymer transport protein ExbD
MSLMQSKSGNGLYRPLAEINVTPLVDVMLVLLIIFMVTAPMLASGMKVNLPQAKQIQPLDQKAPIIITVGKDSALTLGSDPIERDKLIAAVQEKLGSDITQMIHLRGDKEAPYGDVDAIMDLLATNGLTHIAIVADPHSKSDVAAKSTAPVKPDAANPANAAVNPEGTPGQPASKIESQIGNATTTVSNVSATASAHSASSAPITSAPPTVLNGTATQAFPAAPGAPASPEAPHP